jgi:hypothetical protein
MKLIKENKSLTWSRNDFKTENKLMERYILSNEGRIRFTRRKMGGDPGADKFEGYEILDYLFENGSATVKEIEEYTGLSWGQVINRLTGFISRGYVEEQVRPGVS